MYILLIFLLIILLIISILEFDGEILAPPVAMLLMFIFAALLGLIKWNDWRLYEYSGVSVFLLLSGIVFFTLSSFFVRTVVFGGIKYKGKSIPVYSPRIELGSIPLFCFLILGLATNIVLYLTMKRIVGHLGFSTNSISAIINHFRNITTLEVFAGQYDVPSYVKMLIWITTSIGIFCLFVFFHSVVFKVFRKRDILLILVALLWLTAMLLNSHRSYVLTALGISIYLIFFFLNMHYGWQPFVNRKILKLGLRLFILLLIGFIGLAVLLGRFKSIQDINISNYLANYISSGVRNFDFFINDPPETKSYGFETFASLFRSINNQFGLGHFVPTELEFTYINGNVITNIYTAFRRYYSDFGYWGLIIISSFMGGAFTYLYEGIKKRGREGIFDFRLLVFLYFCKGIFQMCIEETILDFEISLNGLFKIIVLYLLYYVFIKKKVRVTL